MSETQRILVAVWNQDLVQVKREDSIVLSTGKQTMGEKLDLNYNKIVKPKDFISLCEKCFTDWLSILKTNTGEIMVKVKAGGKKKKFENSFEASKFIKEVLEDISINIICNEDIIKTTDFLLVAKEKKFSNLETFKIESENLTPHKQKDKLADNTETILIPTWNRNLVHISSMVTRELGISSSSYNLKNYGPSSLGGMDGMVSRGDFIVEPEDFIQFCEDNLEKFMLIFKGNNDEIEVAIKLDKFSSAFEDNKFARGNFKEKGFKSAFEASKFIIDNLKLGAYPIHKRELVKPTFESERYEKFYDLTAFNIKPESLISCEW